MGWKTGIVATCPNEARRRSTVPIAGAKYKVVEVEAPSATADLTCVSCGGALPARDGGLLLKYFLVQRPRRPVGRTDVLARTVPVQPPTG